MDLLLNPCVFCFNLPSTPLPPTITFSNLLINNETKPNAPPSPPNELLLLMCSELKCNFLPQEPFKGFPSCKDCSARYSQLEDLFVQLKSIKSGMQLIFEEFKRKVVHSEIKARKSTSNTLKDKQEQLRFKSSEGDPFLADNCLALREAFVKLATYYVPKNRKPYLVVSQLIPEPVATELPQKSPPTATSNLERFAGELGLRRSSRVFQPNPPPEALRTPPAAPKNPLKKKKPNMYIFNESQRQTEEKTLPFVSYDETGVEEDSIGVEEEEVYPPNFLVKVEMKVEEEDNPLQFEFEDVEVNLDKMDPSGTESALQGIRLRPIQSLMEPSEPKHRESSRLNQIQISLPPHIEVDDTSSDEDIPKLSSSRGVHLNKEKMIPCPASKLVCREMFCTKEDLMEHVMASHTTCSVKTLKVRSKTASVCYFCEGLYPTYKLMRRHLRFHTMEKPYPCPLPHCKKQFLNNVELRRHFHAKHLKD